MTTSRSDSGERYLTPVRGLNEYVYCPRLFHLMYVQGLFEESIDTLEGRLAHKKRINKIKAAVDPDEEAGKAVPWPAHMAREFLLSSDSLGITGKFDVLMSEDKKTIPVEVKHGPAPEGSGQFIVGPHQLTASAWPNDQVQLAAQMALLQEAGYHCVKGRIYYQQTRTVAEIPWTEELAVALRWVAEKTQALASAPMPDPLIDSNKCIRCSLNHVCLPDETLHIKGMLDEPRQLHPGRDDRGVLHLVTPGTHVGKSGDTVKISVPEENEVLIPIKDVAHVCCWGNTQITTQTVLELADRGVGITWLTAGGWLRAVTTAPMEKNVFLRRAQYRVCDDPGICLNIARSVVASKIENQRVLIRRNEKETSVQEQMRILRACREPRYPRTMLKLCVVWKGMPRRLIGMLFRHYCGSKKAKDFI